MLIRPRSGSIRTAMKLLRPLHDQTGRKFTSTRDSYTGFDYADQRYYASTYGRFNTADPYMASAGPGDPGSWNRYSYTRGDPVNRRDPRPV